MDRLRFLDLRGDGLLPSLLLVEVASVWGWWFGPLSVFVGFVVLVGSTFVASLFLLNVNNQCSASYMLANIT